MFESKPLIGYGPNTFRIYCSDQRFEVNDYSCTTYPLHTVSQLLGETGIFGTFFFLLAAIYFIKAIFNHMLELYRREYTSLSDYQICLLACFFCTLWPILPTLNFFNNWISIVYFLPIGFYLQSKKSLELWSFRDTHGTVDKDNQNYKHLPHEVAEKLKKEWRKNKCVITDRKLHDTVYDEHYTMSGANMKISDETMATPSENAKTGELKRLFAKSRNSSLFSSTAC